MPPRATGLSGSDVPLADAYDLAMLDLDGVVYVGASAVPGAPEHLAGVRAAGLRVAFVTNNAARPPAEVADHLTSLGVPAQADDVVTSAQAAARVLAERLGAGARVAMVGARGLREALADARLTVVPLDDGDAAAIVTGYGADVVWHDLMRAAVRIRDGLWWVATNTDMSIPTAYGLAPGHGVQVRMLSEFSRVRPTVAGKPARPLLDETVRRVGGRRPLMVGDRLDTDIDGARQAGVDSLLVLTGVTGLPELVVAPPDQRPTYLDVDLAGLAQPQPPVGVDDDGAVRLGGWTTQVRDRDLTVTGSGSVGDWWRAVAVTGWHHLDLAGDPARIEGLTPPGR